MVPDSHFSNYCRNVMESLQNIRDLNTNPNKNRATRIAMLTRSTCRFQHVICNTQGATPKFAVPNLQWSRQTLLHLPTSPNLNSEFSPRPQDRSVTHTTRFPSRQLDEVKASLWTLKACDVCGYEDDASFGFQG